MASVKLYVYDLSNGMAKQMSRQLTGRQIDGIWHTSVVVFGKEVFYGQGINITAPGRSHHGQPLQVIDVGETALDEHTFEEYIAEMRGHYTADKYHLLDFNCNSFTNDVVGFLTGGSIPPWIKDLPSDFLSTPFGMALRPTIDAMYRRPATGAPVAPPPNQAAQPAPDSQLASALLQAVANRAASSGASLASPSGVSTPSTTTVAAPLHVSSNMASFRSILGSNRAVVAMFTSTTCGPCRMIAPVFEEIAREKTKGEGKTAFVKVDIDVGMSGAIAREYGVRATPTFAFFLDGSRTHELKGVNAPELRTQVDLLIYQAFPPHPHTSMHLPAVEALSLEPILFKQVPALDTVKKKLMSFVEASPVENKFQIKDHLSRTIFPWIKNRFCAPSTPSATPSSTVVSAFREVATALVQDLPTASLFPFLDIWRLALLDASVAQATQTSLIMLLVQIHTSSTPAPRATLLTLLRLLSNGLGTSLARPLLAVDTQGKAALTGVLVATLLNPDRLVRVAAASLAFNVAAWVQRGRVARVKGQRGEIDGAREAEEDGDWEVEIVSAIAQALETEQESEDVVHRLTATLALLVRLSPSFEIQLAPLFEVLQVQGTLKGKLSGDGGLKLQKKDVRVLVTEVADKLCA
ncbi:PPPDE putative peptidase domain-containing protein [Amylostereum chailletii]|nr:PPPDE putative peptidase domain-containing protein [Amylostereum chailletii]